jgi:hypothetical protein
MDRKRLIRMLFFALSVSMIDATIVWTHREIQKNYPGRQASENFFVSLFEKSNDYSS